MMGVEDAVAPSKQQSTFDLAPLLSALLNEMAALREGQTAILQELRHWRSAREAALPEAQVPSAAALPPAPVPSTKLAAARAIHAQAVVSSSDAVPEGARSRRVVPKAAAARPQATPPSGQANMDGPALSAHGAQAQPAARRTGSGHSKPDLQQPSSPVGSLVLPRGGAASGVPSTGYRPGEQAPTTEGELDDWFARRGFRLKRMGQVPDHSPERWKVIRQFGEHHATLKPLLRILKLEEGNARRQELGGPGTSARAFRIFKQSLKDLEACYRVAYLEVDEAKRHFSFDVTIPPHDYAYMVGMWFEAYAMERVVSALGGNAGVFTNVQVELPNGAGAEIDLVVARPNGLYLLECKAGKAGPGLDRFKEVSSLLSGAGAICAVLIPGDGGSQVRQLGAHHKLSVVTPDDLPAFLGVAMAKAPQATASGESLRAEMARHAPLAVAHLKDAGLVLAVRAKPSPSELDELAMLAQLMGMDYPLVFPLLDHASGVAGRPNEVTLGLSRFGPERAEACVALAHQFEEHGLLSKLRQQGHESIRYVPTAEEPYASFLRGTWLELFVGEVLSEACGLEQAPPLVRLASPDGRAAAVGWLADLHGEALWVGRFAPGLDAGWAEGHAHISRALNLPAGRSLVVTAGGPNQPPGKGLLRLRPQELLDRLWALSHPAP